MAALLVALAIPAALALADTPSVVPVTCQDNSGDQATLQAALTSAGTTGDTIEITGLCAGSYTIPDGSSFTIEGASGQTDGFDGQSTAQSSTLLSGTDLGAMTLENLTFENAVEPDDSDPASFPFGDAVPSALWLGVGGGGTATLTDDDFTANTNLDAPSEEIDDDSDGCAPSAVTIAISGSDFTGNTLEQDGEDADALVFGGAGLDVNLDCETDSVALTGNTFSNNVIFNDPGTSEPGTGAGLSIFGGTEDESGDLIPVTQTKNTFSSNAIDAAGGDPVDFFVGAGEAAEGVALQSDNDEFVDNVQPGSDSSSGEYFSAGSSGAGLFLAGTCDATPQATLQQDVVGDNVITMNSSAGDSPNDAEGAAIGFADESTLDFYFYAAEYYHDDYLYEIGEFAYAALCGYGFGPRSSQIANDPANGSDLNLNDSTVNGNAVLDDGTPAAADGGAVAGIDGPVGGTLELDNTIAYGDVGGSDVGGFESQGGPEEGAPNGSASANSVAAGEQITATNSDICDPDNPSSPFTGTGNLCADPQLVTDGYVAPAGLGSEGENSSAGGPAIHDGTASSVSTPPNVRETSSSPTIDAGSNSLVPSGVTADFYGDAREVAKSCPVGAGTVDIGAAEYVPTCVTSTPPATTPPPAPTPQPQPSKVIAPCASLRNIVIHLQYTFFLRTPALIKSAGVTLTSTTDKSLGTRKLPRFGPDGSEVRLNLKTLPFGTYWVHAHVTLTNGLHASRNTEWHTCRPYHWHYKPGKPVKIHWHA